MNLKIDNYNIPFVELFSDGSGSVYANLGKRQINFNNKTELKKLMKATTLDELFNTVL